MMIDTLPTGDKIHKYHRCLVVPFAGKRKVMSTSMHNGGYREDLTAVFNHDVNPGPGMPCEYCKPGAEEKMKRFIVDDLGLAYDSVAYMATIVSMDSAAIKSESFDELAVTAIATASLEVNGGRVGEPATCYEKHGNSINLKPGTINIMVIVNADMTPGCMARTIITATEAKTAALQELMAGSLHSSGIATGSGTDNMMIIANAESDNVLTYAGKHGKLGELIGRMVMQAVTESLEKHMGLSKESQHSMVARLKRYHVTEKTFCDKFNESTACKMTMADFVHRIHSVDGNGEMVAFTSLFVHLLDQLNWGLIAVNEMVSAGNSLLIQMAKYFKNDWMAKEVSVTDEKDCIQSMLDNFVAVICAGAVAFEVEPKSKE